MLEYTPRPVLSRSCLIVSVYGHAIMFRLTCTTKAGPYAGPSATLSKKTLIYATVIECYRMRSQKTILVMVLGDLIS